MLTVALAIAIALTEIDVAAREEAERDVIAAVNAYADALFEGQTDLASIEQLLSERQIALHAIYERDRMRQIGLAADIERLRASAGADAVELQRLEDELAELRRAREEYLARWAATEKKQQELLTSAWRLRL